MNALLTGIADLYAGKAQAGGEMLEAAASELRSLAVSAPLRQQPSRLAVCRHLPAVLALARSGPLAELAEQFALQEPLCRWRHNESYLRSAGEAFLDGYGYVEIVGRDAPWPSDLIAVGFLLLGPSTDYPLHHHPAAEVYHVVAGHARWRRGDEPVAVKPPGSIIHHPPNVPHAMRTGTEPLLALYCWTGEITVAAALTSAAGA